MWKAMQEKLHQLASAVVEWLDDWLDNISLRHKLYGMFVLCVLCPLVLTDSMVLSVLIRAEERTRMQTMENTAEAVAYDLETTLDEAVDLIRAISQNRYIKAFVEGNYPTALDYYNGYRQLLEDSLYEVVMGTGDFQCVIYADNPDFINGGYFCRLETAQEEEWYRVFCERDRQALVYAYYGQVRAGYRAYKTVSIIHRMDNCAGENIIKLDIDYSGLSRALSNARYANTVYICSGDKILLSNDGRGGLYSPFQTITEDIRWDAGLRRQVQVSGGVWEIYVMPAPVAVLGVLWRYVAIILFLVAVNILLPMVFMRLLNRSFTRRLRLLSDSFRSQNAEQLEPIGAWAGRDEIGALMRSYNHMAERMNELIQTVYKDRLRQQETDIARQTAELLALHSQINPHFLFNALESIRMHSILKGETETADMVEQLAVMQRQNVEWSRDSVPVREELRFVEAYLELQKYRFGERLSYEIEAEEDCRALCIPRLSLVTFVENACIHGIEKKTSPGWIFARVYRLGEDICLEVEDTGIGMPPEQAQDMQRRMNDAEIGQLRKKGRVGILNACIRLKMSTGGQVRFVLESEENAGTVVTVRIPAACCEKEDTDA